MYRNKRAIDLQIYNKARKLLDFDKKSKKVLTIVKTILYAKVCIFNRQTQDIVV